MIRHSFRSAWPPGRPFVVTAAGERFDVWTQTTMRRPSSSHGRRSVARWGPGARPTYQRNPATVSGLDDSSLAALAKRCVTTRGCYPHPVLSVRRRSMVIAAAGALVLATSPAATIPGVATTASSSRPARSGPSGSIPAEWAWVVARDATTIRIYTPDRGDTRNSAGTDDTVQRQALGRYLVTFPGLQLPTAPDGVSLATALASGGRSCSLGDQGNHQGASGMDVRVEVDCWTRSGAPADTPFSLSYLAHGDIQPATLAYLWANEQSTTDYQPDPTYSFVSSGAGPIAIHRSAVGTYAVTLPGLGVAGGNVQLTANAGVCRSVAQSKQAGAERIDVICRDSTGQLLDTTFDLVFERSVGLTGVVGRTNAYVRASRPSVSSYQVGPPWSFSSGGAHARVTRSGVGRYRVTLPDMPRGGAAEVTALGSGTSVCELSSIRTLSKPQSIGVRCSRPLGDPVDSAFSLSYTK
jgi:hypothetical protein